MEHRCDSGRIGVMQVVDALMAGGLERTAVNIANALPQDRYVSHLCTTRREGPMADLVAPHVGRLRLGRRRRVDLPALWRAVRYARSQRIRVLHAHGTSLFFAGLVSVFLPRCRLIWHVHHGRFALDRSAPLPYRLAARVARTVLTVNEPLRSWARESLRLPEGRVVYVPNFAPPPTAAGDLPLLPGKAGGRVVCVANLLPDKDPLNLVRAMAGVVAEVPEAHLLMVGRDGDSALAQQVRAEVSRLQLNNHVSFLGLRTDVPAVLAACDVGVLSSASEGFPMVLLEYGTAGLGVAATDVGQCAEILDGGRAGLLVPPRQPEALAQALIALLQSPEKRAHYGQALRSRVLERYSQQSVIASICQVYETVLAGPVKP